MTPLVRAAALTAALLCAGACKDSGEPRTGTPDVVLIVVDALRADHTNAYGYQRETTPALSVLASHGIVFENAFAAAPKTIPSIPQTLSSSYFPDTERPTTLMELAAAPGDARSLAVVNNPYVQKWVQRLTPTFEHVVAGDMKAAEIIDHALEWIEAGDAGSRLIYLHFLDTHTPYDVAPPFKSMFVDSAYDGPVGLEFGDVAGAWSGRYDEEDQRRIVDLYDGTIAAVDAELGRLFAGLVDAGVYDDALVIVTADHGEEFWDHGGFFHGQSLYDELLRVPLIVKLPGDRHAATRRSDVVSTVDILPTIAAAISADSGAEPDPRWRGRALFDTAPDVERIVFATVGRADGTRPPRHAVRSADHKLIVNLVDGSRELYLLDEDPKERRNVIAYGTQVPDVLENALAEAVAPLEAGGVQLSLTNRGPRGVSYEVTISTDPPAPLVNLHRNRLEKRDSLILKERSASLLWRGTLKPEEHDGARFDVLGREGRIVVKLTVDGHRSEARAIRIGSEGAAAVYNPVSLLIEDVDGPPSSATAAIKKLLPSAVDDATPIELHVWRSGSSEHALPPGLTDEERKRVRALGYVD